MTKRFVGILEARLSSYTVLLDSGARSDQEDSLKDRPGRAIEINKKMIAPL